MSYSLKPTMFILKRLIYSRYFVDGHDNKAVCVDGVWVTASPLICSPVDCGRPQVKLASVACSDGTTYSNKCHFKCDKPALLLGKNY